MSCHENYLARELERGINNVMRIVHSHLQFEYSLPVNLPVLRKLVSMEGFDCGRRLGFFLYSPLICVSREMRKALQMNEA